MKRNSNRILLAALVVMAALSLVSCKTADVPAPAPVVPAVEPVAEPVVTEKAFEAQSYSFKIHGFDFKAELVSPNTVVLSYPEFITSDEIVSFAKSFFEAYPLYLKNSTLEYGKGYSTLTLGYNVKEEEFNAFAPVLGDSVTSYVEAYLAHLDKVAADLKAAEDALAKAKTEAEKKAAAEAKAAAEKAAAEAQQAAADKAASEAKASADKAAAEKAAADAKAAQEATDKAVAQKKAEEAAAAAAAATKDAAKKSAAGVVILILVICLAGAAAVYYFLVIKKKK